MSTVSESYITMFMAFVGVDSDLYKDEVKQSVEACLQDMTIKGVHAPLLSDPIIQQAVKHYLKGYCGFDQNPERYAAMYDALRDSLALNGTYNGTESESS